MPEYTFGVISDLHCRLETDARDSFLTVGSLRMPANRHPVQALLSLITNEGLTTDALLVPGDLTNKARREGLNAGWDYSREIGAALHARAIIPVIGNHDINSRRDHTQPPVFHDIRNLHPDFPFSDDAQNQSYFSDGYCVVRLQNADIIAINTVIDHTDETSAMRGTFGIDRIERMENALTGTLNAPFRIALMHHHPILHSGSLMGDADVLATGDSLIASLDRLGCRLVIHGHKHLARLSVLNGMAVMASGSFSAMLFEYATAFTNTFHTVHLEGNSPANVRGKIRTWAFRYGSGWQKANETYCGLPFICGFGNNIALQTLAQSLVNLASNGNNRFTEDQVRLAVPTLDFLTPSERVSLNAALHSNGLKLSSLDDGRPELWKEYIP